MKLFICKKCSDDYGINTGISEQLGNYEKALKNQGVARNEVDNIISLANDTKEDLIEDITEEGEDKCGICYIVKQTKGGIYVRDWEKFLKDMESALRNAREVGKRSGKNIMPYTKYMAVMVAIKAMRLKIRAGQK